MLTYAFTALETGEYHRLTGEEFSRIHDLLAAILIKDLGSRRQRGSGRDHESFEKDLVFMWRRIDPATTIRLDICRSRRVRCRYDGHTESTVANHILKTAAWQLFLHGDVIWRHKARLESALLGIGSVEILNGEELRCLRWDTLPTHHGNRSYQLLVEVSYPVLNELLLGHIEGGLKLAGFLNPQVLSTLYERFVLAYFRCHHPGLRPAAPWVSGGIRNAPTFLPGIHTDVVLTDLSRVLIIDTKCHDRILETHHDHKVLSVGNRNQICGYVTHETHNPRQRDREVERVLFYAQTTTDPPPQEVWIKTGHRFHIRTLDLGQDFTEIASRPGEIVGLIKAA